MCMLLHRYTVFVILSANGTPFYNSGLVFDHIPLSIYALQCCMHLWTLITICIVYQSLQNLLVFFMFFIGLSVRKSARMN